jgi:beta-lactamase superfamily II metal-dependent hydrolase
VSAAPPRLSIFHFDVNAGDATLFISPDKRGVLIDGGGKGRGFNPIKEFLDRAKRSGDLVSLDFVIATHYDPDHIGGLDEVLNHGWYPRRAVYDRGNTFLPPFDRTYVQESCRTIEVDAAENVVDWGTAPPESCPPGFRRVDCQTLEYILAAENGGKRQTIRPSEVLVLDHGLELVALVVNAEDIDGDTTDVHFPGRRDDCASDDLSIGLLVKFGDFRYLIAGDLTGAPEEGVANVEKLIGDDAREVDVYHVNHHGALTSSSWEFMQAIHPRVAIISNSKHLRRKRPRGEVIRERILRLDPAPAIYLTNRNPSPGAWDDDPDAIADWDSDGYDAMIELAVWRETFRIFRWRHGSLMHGSDQFRIKPPK